MVKNPPPVQETGVQSLGWENLLEEGMATLSSILPWRIPWTEGTSRLLVYMVTKSWTQLKQLHTHMLFYIQIWGLPWWLR